MSQTQSDKPIYPALPEGCTLEPGRRQLAVGENRQIGDHEWFVGSKHADVKPFWRKLTRECLYPEVIEAIVTRAEDIS